ncbi:MAG: hypothetical protein AAFR21_11540 [Pseudomonadota bacterium]
MTTVTEIMMRENERRHQERVRRVHQEFLEVFAPDDARARAEFEARLADLLREAAIEALEPFQKAAAAQIASRTMPPFVFKTGAPNSDF